MLLAALLWDEHDGGCPWAAIANFSSLSTSAKRSSDSRVSSEPSQTLLEWLGESKAFLRPLMISRIAFRSCLDFDNSSLNLFSFSSHTWTWRWASLLWADFDIEAVKAKFRTAIKWSSALNSFGRRSKIKLWWTKSNSRFVLSSLWKLEIRRNLPKSFPCHMVHLLYHYLCPNLQSSLGRKCLHLQPAG